MKPVIFVFQIPTNTMLVLWVKVESLFTEKPAYHFIIQPMFFSSQYLNIINVRKDCLWKQRTRKKHQKSETRFD